MSTRSRLRAPDLAPLALLELRGRPVHAALSATGVAIGVATLVAVLGISASSQAQLIAQIDALGTNLLTVSPNSGFTGQATTLPSRAPAMISRIGPVTSDAATWDLAVQVYRNRDIPQVDGPAITVKAAGTDLLRTVQGHMWAGQFLNATTAPLPAVACSGHCGERPRRGPGRWQRRSLAAGGPVVRRRRNPRAGPVGSGTRWCRAHRLPGGTPPPAPPGLTWRDLRPDDPVQVRAVASVLAATSDPAAPQNATVAELRPTP